MKTFRIVVGILAIIPLVLIADQMLFHPIGDGENSLDLLVYFTFGVPILVLNLWAWIYPEFIEFYFFGRVKK